jgi:deazaflavin-dependent oxidoreductase (nitroreductase family)
MQPVMGTDMSLIGKLPRRIWRLLQLPPRLAYAIGLGPLIGRFVLLLTTTGRRTGKKRITPLQYEEIGGNYYIAAARGDRTDWLKNIEADPQIHLQVRSLRLRCFASVIRDVDQITDFLNYRLRRHPRMIGAIMRAAGLSPSPSIEQLRAYAAERLLVRLEPIAKEATPGAVI